MGQGLDLRGSWGSWSGWQKWSLGLREEVKDPDCFLTQPFSGFLGLLDWLGPHRDRNLQPL